MTATELVCKLNQNRIFRFVSTVRLAVPLMLILAATVAYGTIVESNYNSDYAKLMIYNSTWFMVLLCFLFLNVFSSTLSRFPYHKRHVGFVITHLGLMTLLTGALITSVWGVDGQLRVTEGGSNSVVVLPRLMLSYRFEGSPRAQNIVFDKRLGELSGSSLDFINDSFGHIVRAERMLPFATVQKTFVKSEGDSDSVALSFILRSQFFNVSEWLNSADNREMQMGPATLRLVRDQGLPSRQQQRRLSAVKENLHPSGSSHDQVLIKEVKTGQTVASWDLSHSSFTWKNLHLTLKKKFAHAVVAQNKLTEGHDQPEPNPALELEVSAGAKNLREVLFAKFPNFSLNKQGLFGYTLEFRHSGQGEDLEPIAPSVAAEPSAAGAGGHVVEFHVDPTRPDQARVELYKNGQMVGSQTLHEGQGFQTPWMGMKVTLATLTWGGKPSLVAKPVEPQRGQDLPPSALFLRPPQAQEGFWLSEGDQRTIQFNGRNVEISFGRENLTLPFSLNLQKFTKLDYPGTETPISFESLVDVGDGLVQRIAMNEPLQRDGYTVYQASYVMNENGPPDSVFSVNRDPGRRVKYSGSLILAIGIIVFTVSRSRRFQQRFEGPKA